VQRAALPPVVRGRWYPMSWEEFLEWAPDEGQSEWVDGKGIADVSNAPRHIRMVFFLAQLLGLYTRAVDFGEVFVDKLLVRLPMRPAGRMPDIVVVGREDRPRAGDRWFAERELLMTEFISEDSVERDLVEKRAEAEQAGMREYPVIDARPGQRDFL
jgi:Uma2 family endonuclease